MKTPLTNIKTIFKLSAIGVLLSLAFLLSGPFSSSKTLLVAQFLINLVMMYALMRKTSWMFQWSFIVAVFHFVSIPIFILLSQIGVFPFSSSSFLIYTVASLYLGNSFYAFSKLKKQIKKGGVKSQEQEIDAFLKKEVNDSLSSSSLRNYGILILILAGLWIAAYLFLTVSLKINKGNHPDPFKNDPFYSQNENTYRPE